MMNRHVHSITIDDVQHPVDIVRVAAVDWRTERVVCFLIPRP